MRKKSAITLALVSALTLCPVVALAADQYAPDRVEMLPRDSKVLVMITEEGLVNNESGMVIQNRQFDPANPHPGPWCTSTKVSTCDLSKAEQDILASSILPMCVAANDPACIEKLELAPAGGDFVEAKYERTATGGFLHDADPKLNLLQGAAGSIFDAPSVPSASGTSKYAVVLKVGQNFSHAAGKFNSPESIKAMVVPVRDDTGAQYGNIAADGSGGGATNVCAYFDVGHCGIPQDFADGTKVRLSIRAPKTLGGWFRGRIKSPNISVESANSSSNRIVMEGESNNVARLAYVQEKVTMTDDDRNFLSTTSNWGSQAGIAYGFDGSEQKAPELIDHFRTKMKDTATGTSSFWTMGTIPGGYGSGCLSDTSKVLGIVTTNAMAYEGSAPSFRNGELDYKVAGLHYLPDGKDEVQGSYNLVLRSETARCLYGFNKAPISAKISVTSASGEAKVATTVMSEKDGWVKLAAYGFTFSSPTISVKLTQEGSASAPSAKKTTITCTNGKLTKKVTSVGPKCPVGYKKK